jgi:hypothetical protein
MLNTPLISTMHCNVYISDFLVQLARAEMLVLDRFEDTKIPS